MNKKGGFKRKYDGGGGGYGFMDPDLLKEQEKLYPTLSL
jgi:hypothetical protein